MKKMSWIRWARAQQKDSEQPRRFSALDAAGKVQQNNLMIIKQRQQPTEVTTSPLITIFYYYFECRSTTSSSYESSIASLGRVRQ